MNSDLTESKFFRFNPEPMWIFDIVTLRFLDVNDAAIKKYGYTLDEFLSMGIDAIRPEEEVESLRTHLGRRDEDDADLWVWRHRLKSGEIIYVNVIGCRLSYRDRDAIAVTVQDISRLVKLEQEKAELLEREKFTRRQAEANARYFQTLFETIPGKFLVVTPEQYEIVAVSDAYLEATMAEREQLKGRLLFDAFPDDPADLEANGVAMLRKSLDRARETGVADVMAVQRYPVRRPEVLGGGFEERYWSSVNTPVKGPDGSVAYIVHRVEDVTGLVRGAMSGAETNALAAIEERDAAVALDIVLRSRELMEANIQLQEQEANLRTAQRLLGVGIWRLDLDEDRLTWSANVFDMCGVSPDSFTGNFEAYFTLVHPDDRSALRTAFDKFLAGSGKHYQYEHRLIRPDGRIVHVKGAGELTDSDQGRILTGVIQDVSAEVESRNQLTALSTALRLAGKVARLGGWRFDIASEHLVWIGETAAIFEEPENFQPDAESALNYYEPEAQARILEMYGNCIAAGEPFDEVMPLITAKGRRVWVRAIGEAEYDDLRNIVAVHGAIQDISEFVAAHNRSEELSAQLVESLQNMSDAFFTLDSAWRFTFINKQAENILDRTRVELLGKIVWDEFPSAMESVFESEYKRAVRDRVAVRFTEYYPPLKKWIEVNAYPGAGSLSVYFRDVTAARQRDEQLHQAQKMELIGQLTGGIAHDFNNLLTIVLGNTELLAEALAGNEELAGLAQVAIGAAERGAELTNRLLAFAKKQTLKPELVDLNHLLTGVAPILRRALTENIDINIQPETQLWNVEIDRPQLESAILNLAINSRDAMSAGGALVISTANCRLSADEAALKGDVPPGDYVVIEIADNGSGITPEVKERVFEPFYTTKDIGKGSGLGLSMVLGFVKQSKGHIELDSEPGVGTTIRLFFPRSFSEVREVVGQASQTPIVVGGSEHVLAVEDDELVREHLVSQLQKLGYRVSSAANGSEALGLLKELSDIDLLLTDIVMPGGMNGRELADAATVMRPGLKILFTSGYTGGALQHEGRLLDGVELLAKPYRRQELAAKVRKVLLSSHSG